MKLLLTTTAVALLALGSAAFAGSGSSGASNNETARSNLQSGSPPTEGGSMRTPGQTDAATGVDRPRVPQSGMTSSGAAGTAPYTSGGRRPRDPAAARARPGSYLPNTHPFPRLPREGREGRGRDGISFSCHCEERSDEAIQRAVWIASLRSQ